MCTVGTGCPYCTLRRKFMEKEKKSAIIESVYVFIFFAVELAFYFKCKLAFYKPFVHKHTGYIVGSCTFGNFQGNLVSIDRFGGFFVFSVFVI